MAQDERRKRMVLPIDADQLHSNWLRMEEEKNDSDCLALCRALTFIVALP